VTAERRPIVGGNWKMNTDLASATELSDDIVAGLAGMDQSSDIALYPPFLYLQMVGKTLGHHPILLGAQDVWPELNGAFTGEVSTAMLNDLDVESVLVGHSERRHVIGEDDALIARKLGASLAADLCGVLCVGETLEQRESGQTEAVVLGQLEAALAEVDVESAGRLLVIAYEPVWAIGTGRTASPEDAQQVHAAIRQWLAQRYDGPTSQAIRIQYGGSVKPGNAAELFAQPDIDGFLVGGASLNADDFLAIVRVTAVGVDTARAGSSTK